MKRKLAVIAMLVLTSNAFAQWKVAIEDDGFDDRSVVATVLSKDGDARISMAKIDKGLVLGVRTPEITFIDKNNDVEITFKIKGVNKTYKVLGLSSRGDSYIILAPQGGNLNNIGDLLSDEFLTDFKSASLMKMKISYSVPYRGSSYKSYEEYVFNMTGSTNAYTRVSNQK